MPWSARARTDVTPMCGASPRYGSTSCDGYARTARSVAAGARPSSAARKKPTSALASSMSASLGSTYSTTLCGRACAALATSSAFAGAVRPDTTRAGTSMPLRAIAVFRTARRFREVEVATAGPTSQCSAGAIALYTQPLKHEDTKTVLRFSSSRFRGFAVAFDRRGLFDVVPADLRVRGDRSRGATAKDAIEVPRLDLAGAGTLHPHVGGGKRLARLHVLDRDDAGVREIDGGLFFRKNRLAASERLENRARPAHEIGQLGRSDRYRHVRTRPRLVRREMFFEQARPQRDRREARVAAE